MGETRYINATGWGSPAKYIQGPGEIFNLAKYCEMYGRVCLALITSSCYNEYDLILKEVFTKEGYVYLSMSCPGNSSVELMEEISNKYLYDSVNFVIGFGGGRVIDIAKAVGYKLYAKVVIVPTIASTDAAITSRSVIYKLDGTSYSLKYPTGPDLVLVDSKMILKGPVRYLIAGMGDALSTYWEAKANKIAGRKNLLSGNFRQTCVGSLVSEGCFHLLMEYGMKAKGDMENQNNTQALETIIEVNILMSGLGAENAGCGVAHSIGEGIALVPDATPSLHGEQVAFGVICQLLAARENRDDVNKIIAFNDSVGLPITLYDFGIEASDENVQIIAEMAFTRTCWLDLYPSPINEVESVKDIIRKADRIGTKYRELKKNFKT